MNLFFRKRMALAAGAVSIMALCVLSSIGAIAGGAGGGGVAGGGGGTEASLSNDPFAGDVVGEVQFSLPDIDEISLTAAAARAEPSTLNGLVEWLKWFKKKFQFILDTQLGLPWLGISDIGVETGKTKLTIIEKQRFLIIEYADMLRDKSYTVSEVTNYISIAAQIKGASETQIRDALIEEANNIGIELTEHQLND